MTKMNGMAREIRAFVETHANGWNHHDWLGFLHHLGESGHDVSDPDSIGLGLEQDRLEITLKKGGIRGLGPKRIESITREYATVQNLRVADGPDVAKKTGISQVLAEQVAGLFR